MSCVTLELYVRSLAPVGGEPSRAETIERLGVLAEHENVDEYEVVVWGQAIPAGIEHPLADRLDRFQQWADDHDATLVGVEKRDVGSLVDEPQRLTILPSVALAEYQDDELVGVTPHERDGALRTVADHLGALALDPSPWTERELAASD